MPDDEARGGSQPEAAGVSRRRFLGGALGTAGAVAAGGIGFGVAQAEDASADTAMPDLGAPVPFYGKHQAGIATAAQDRMAFAAFDVTSSDAGDLQRMLAMWAGASAQMAQGKPIGGPPDTPPSAPPPDTGEAFGLPASQLTITVGFGPSLFDERFGLAPHRPAALRQIPPLPGDYLQPERSGGDLCVQACANDPQVAFHAVRDLARMARGTAVVRWFQLGFGRTSSTSTQQQTPRNLLGFKDGTNNIKAENAADFDDFVWVGQESDQPWMAGGSYLVARRIRMLVENWDTDNLGDQQHIFGRYKVSGAPLTGNDEFDKVKLDAKKPNGKPVIPLDAHIRLAAPSNNQGQKILRRGYSYTDGMDPRTGFLDAGLFFIVFCQDPRTQFTPIQRRLGQYDALNEYIRHTSSAVFAVPPGLAEAGDYYGKPLFT